MAGKRKHFFVIKRQILIIEIKIDERHRGLLLTSTGTGGIWYGHVPGNKYFF